MFTITQKRKETKMEIGVKHLLFCSYNVGWQPTAIFDSLEAAKQYRVISFDDVDCVYVTEWKQKPYGLMDNKTQSRQYWMRKICWYGSEMTTEYIMATDENGLFHCHYVMDFDN